MWKETVTAYFMVYPTMKLSIHSAELENGGAVPLLLHTSSWDTFKKKS
jgi:hypothetical protein